MPVPLRDTPCMGWWDAFDSPLADEEGTLPAPLEDELFDEFDFIAWLSYEEVELDDRPEWEKDLGERKCKRCSEMAMLDSLRHCRPCRIALGRCSWCGIDSIVYIQPAACGACYRWLRRNLRPGGLRAAQRRLIENAVVRQSRRRGGRA